MTWARAALTGGLLVLLATFGVATENMLSTTVMGQTRECGPSISGSWLMSGTDQAPVVAAPTSDERRVAAACRPVVHESRVLLLTITGVGGILVLVGWTAISSRSEAVPAPL